MPYLSKLSARLAFARTSRLLGALVIVGCSDDASPTGTLLGDGDATAANSSTVSSIAVSPSSATLTVGDSIRISTTVRDRRGRIIQSANVNWTSSAPTVASVSAQGLVRALSAGAATISAKSGRASATVAVTTRAATVPITTPGTVTNLTVSASTSTSLTVSFTAVTDGAGGGAHYALRIATPTLNWSSAENVTTGSCALPIVSAAVGTTQSCTVAGLLPGSTYQLQVVAFRGSWTSAPVLGALSNLASGSTLAASAPPPPAGLTFSSDWSTATGNSGAAINDGGRWSTVYCQQAPNVLSVVPGSSVGWTKTPNVLRVLQSGPTECGTLEKVDAVPLSTSHWGRFYFRNDEVGTQHNHVATYNPGVGAPIQTALWNRWGAPDGVSIFIRTYFGSNGAATSYPTNFWSIGRAGVAGRDRLPNGVWYRYEWHLEYVTPTTYRIWPRIYSMAGTLLYDASRFFQNDYPQSGTHSLASWYAAGNTFGFSDVSLARRFGLGNEGPGGSTNTGGYWYHADVALSTAGWIGQ